VRIDQIIPTIVPGDAVSNECLRMQEILVSAGYRSSIYAENVHPRLASKAYDYKKYRDSADNVLIYHYSIGSDLTAFVKKLRCKKIMRYHNITPYEYFNSYNDRIASLCRKGRDDLVSMRAEFYRSIADSEFNRKELVDIGYMDVEVLPILLNFREYDDAPVNEKISSGLAGKKNIIFVGKIAPHKAQKDLVKIFYYYNRYINPDSRLIIVGSCTGFEKYHKELLQFIDKLGLKEVVITGSIPFGDLVTYFRSADLFLCASEHEGFCVPLVEAMHFDIPILTYGSTAIPDTLKGAGIIFKNKSSLCEVAEMINIILTDKDYRDKIIARQRQALSSYEPGGLESKFKKIVGIE
jgi:glycosyltransferase involved in cell wall biosynthesis